MRGIHRRSAFTSAVGLLLATLSTGNAVAQRDPPPPQALQAEFRQFIVGFRQALKANDPGAVAALTRLPIHYDNADRDRAYFESRIYRRMFTQRDRTCLQTARPVYDRDGYGNESFFLFCGGNIFIFSKKADGFRFEGTHPND